MVFALGFTHNFPQSFAGHLPPALEHLQRIYGHPFCKESYDVRSVRDFVIQCSSSGSHWWRIDKLCELANSMLNNNAGKLGPIKFDLAPS